MKNNKTIFLSCIDHTVSNEKFDLIYDDELDMLITSPKPSINQLPKYYESDDYISHTDSKKTLFEKVYQLVKNYALKKKVILINKESLGKGKLLDVGAGTGDFLLAAKNNGWLVNGVEPNTNARKLALEKSIQLNNDINNFQGEKYDVITMWHVLEHVTNLDEFIETLNRLLKPDGTIIIAVPNFKSYDANYYKEFWAAYDVPRHLWHFSKTSIKKIFIKKGIKLKKIKPLKFDSFYVSLLSQKYKTGKMNLIKAFIVGMKSNLKAKSSGNYSSLIYILKK